MRGHTGALPDAARLRTRRHATALFGATAARLCALLAVPHLMLFAFFAAGIAHVGTDIAECGGELASARHVAGRHAADLRTVHIELDAARHHFYVIFGQAGGSAVIAGRGACITLVDTSLELFMSHGNLL
jgi:hypothetical protein